MEQEDIGLAGMMRGKTGGGGRKTERLAVEFDHTERSFIDVATCSGRNSFLEHGELSKCKNEATSVLVKINTCIIK